MVGQLATELGTRAFIVAGISGDIVHILGDILRSSSLQITVYPIAGEPTIEVVNKGVEEAKQFDADLVIGFGGGSALDCAKAIAAMLTNSGNLTKYLEVVGQGRSLTIPPLPVITIPTTAGTGSEVTRNAVIGVPENAVKVSLRSPMMLPRLALIDPELTYNLPPDLTASTGLDALTQLIEPFVCNAPTPITDGMCREGMKHSASALLEAYQDGHNTTARQKLCVASLLGGLALANARLGAVHGIAGVLGGMFSIPHGAICARLLPFVMEINIRALRAREQNNNILERFREVSRILTGSDRADARDGVLWVHELCSQLNIQPLGRLGVDQALLSDLIEKSIRSSSMKGNPVTLNNDELLEILERAM